MAGQGIVAETFAMSQLRGFRTGGTIHFVINILVKIFVMQFLF